MLTDKDFAILEKQASELYADLELEIIQGIAERIANIGYANTVTYNNAIILQEMGYLYQDIINKVAEYNQMSAKEIQDIFENAGIISIERDDLIYKQAGLNKLAISDNLKELMRRATIQTQDNLVNLTRTTATTTQTQFLEGINKAYLETSTGVKSYSQAITDVVKSISQNGAYIQYPTGTKRSIESAVRTNVLTSVNQMSGQLQLARGQEYGWDMYEVSAHGGARPEHAKWQGKVYTEKQLYDICEYGTMLGLCGINCRHTFYPYYKGSTKTYTNKELKEINNRKVNYNGQEISEYEATQIQRKLERNIRNNKKEIAGLQGLYNSTKNNDTKTEMQNIKNKMRNNNKKLNNFLDQTEFRKDYSRLVI